jgi:hypothetical protein
MPVRRDLAGNSTVLPPFFIRDGQSGLFEWLPVQNPQPGQVLPYEIYPASAMPSVVNPKNGWFVNANNDPVGNTLDNNALNDTHPDVPGIYYLNPGYASGAAGPVACIGRWQGQRAGHGRHPGRCRIARRGILRAAIDRGAGRRCGARRRPATGRRRCRSAIDAGT